ncbi:MAG TPA: hypothetical protein DEH78_09330 [Solibacterales bacterium]|nr:hypothetical protein [Bryobacterales bacterium]
MEFDPDQWLERLRAGTPESDFLVRHTHEPVSPLRGEIALPAIAQDPGWPQFRGPNGSGIGAAYPIEFRPATNVAWRTPLPYRQSSPVIAAGRVYVTASEGSKLLTIRLDAKTGKELWRKELPRRHRHNGATGVYVFFADFGLAS